MPVYVYLIIFVSIWLPPFLWVRKMERPAYLKKKEKLLEAAKKKKTSDEDWQDFLDSQLENRLELLWMDYATPLILVGMILFIIAYVVVFGIAWLFQNDVLPL